MKKLILPLLLMFAVVFGVTQMANENDVFAESLIYWCAYGECESLDCDTPVGIYTYVEGKPHIPKYCTVYTYATCQDCVNLTIQGETCPSGSSSCLNPN